MNKTTNLTFTEAIDACFKGKKARRETYAPQTFLIIDDFNCIRISNTDFKERISWLLIEKEDFYATDWQILED